MVGRASARRGGGFCMHLGVLKSLSKRCHTRRPCSSVTWLGADVLAVSPPFTLPPSTPAASSCTAAL